MITIRRSDERGHGRHGWLDSRHTFSFANYRDPRFVGFGPLLVINEDRVAPGAGFPTHPHRDMEILTWVLEGALEHKDSTGTSAVIRPGELQRMSAGTGIRHSEFNHSKTEPVHFLQIWITPEREGLPPGYEQKSFAGKIEGGLRLIASHNGRDGSIIVHQDADVWSAHLARDQESELSVAAGRGQWVQVTRGEVRLNGERLVAGDGAALEGESVLRIRGTEPADLLVFDMAA
jgi:redox-sensitive bicupin YhaK (pirin superfamily)